MHFSPEKPGESLILIDGPAGQLELLLSEGLAGRGVLVVSHPHPLGGGSMNNKVVSSLIREAHERGLSCVRFNFRGVGQSQGVHDHGQGEQDDLRTVIAAALQRWPGERLLLAGFSFGSYIAASVAAQAQPSWSLQGLLLVAPPVHNYPLSSLSLPSPTWILQGDADELVDAQEVQAWASASAAVDHLDMVESCGHFFHGRLDRVRAFMGAAIDRLLP